MNVRCFHRDGYATPVPGAHRVTSWEVAGPARVITVELFGDDPYEAFIRLPSALLYHDVIYGKSGYDSDRRLAFYRTDTRLARDLSDDGRRD